MMKGRVDVVVGGGAAAAATCALFRRPARLLIREMHSFSDTKRVPFSADLACRVVADVNSYKLFVPWCAESEIIRHYNDSIFIADLKVNFGAFSERYRSKVLVEPCESVNAVSLDSELFKTLENRWTFEQSSASKDECTLTCSIDVEFRSALYNMQSSLFAHTVAAKMVDAFVDRCHHIDNCEKTR